MQQNLTNAWPLFIIILAIAVICWLFSRRQRSNKQTQDDELNTLCNYFKYVNSTRAFPTVALDTITPKKNEFCLINKQATLYELRAHRQSVGISFRVAKGVYVGKRAYLSKDHLDRTAVGTVILTNQRLVFVSASKTVTVQIGNIITAQAGRDSLQVHSEKRQRPIILQFPSAQLAALLITAFLRHPFTENILPKGLTITATPMANEGAITLSFKDADEPQLAATR
jgi:hypothetical protein